ncbi:MAG: SDR family oxidoreductase [Anaerolineales bacterium]|nr:SDR family oxidoreductase [Anaerolineales bacterium]
MTRTALITGAAGGIGWAAAMAFHEAGWSTFVVDRNKIKNLPEGIQAFQADVSQEEGVRSIFSWFSDYSSTLDTLVNNAAIQICKPLVTMTVDEWDTVQHSNLRSVFLTAREGYPFLKACKGSIVNVSSVHAVATSADIASYAASKGGVVSLTRAMAIEFAADGIRVNAVCPGAVDTPMLHAGLSRGHVSGGSIEDRMAELGAKTVIGRVGKPEEIASTILFLADSNQSSFITGSHLLIDGGATTRLSTE